MKKIVRRTVSLFKRKINLLIKAIVGALAFGISKYILDALK